MCCCSVLWSANRRAASTAAPCASNAWNKSSNLPEASQQRLRERFQQLRGTADPLFEQMRKAQDDAVQLLGAESFDEAALDRQEAKINDLRAQMSKKLSQSVKLAIKDLSPEERRRFAQMLRRPPPPSQG
jgi:uncharacterized membrane protein